MQIDTLFSIPVLRHKVPDKLADEVEDYFLTIKDQIPFSNDQYSDFFMPIQLFKFDSIPDLLSEIETARSTFTEATGILSVNDGMKDYWIQDYSEDGLKHGRHAHGPKGVSGVYWIRANESAGAFCLHNPNILNEYCAKVPTVETPFTWDDYHYQPTKGHLIIFASYLQHEVLPSGPGAIRSTLAFNFPDQ